MITRRKRILWALPALALAGVLCRVLLFPGNAEIQVRLSGGEARDLLSIERGDKPGATMPCTEYRGIEPLDLRRALKDWAYLKKRVLWIFRTKPPALVTTDASLAELAAELAVCGNPKGIIVPSASARTNPALSWHGQSKLLEPEGGGSQDMGHSKAAPAQKFGPFDSRLYSSRNKAANAIRKLLTDAGWRLARLTDARVAIVSPTDLELLLLASAPEEKERLLKEFNQPQSPSNKQAAAQLLSIFWRAGLLPDSLKSRLAPDHFPGQLGRWKFNEEGGKVVRDSSGPLQGNDGTLVGGPSWVEGRKGSALQFRENEMVMLGNIFQRGCDGISVGCWLKHGSSFWQSIVQRSNWDNPDGIGLWADWRGSGVSFGHYLSGFVTSRTLVQDDRWHHVLGTMSRGAGGFIYRIYVDGKLDNSATTKVGLVDTSGPWSVGSRFDGAWHYRGEVEDVRIFNRALDASEVEKIYHE